MTDLEIVQTLAVFMGEVDADQVFRITQCGTSLTPEQRKRVLLYSLNPSTGHGTEEFLEYLTSYDALAPIWKKLAPLRKNEHTGGIEAGGWYEFSPRAHAEALAEMIKENGDGSSGA